MKKRLTYSIVDLSRSTLTLILIFSKSDLLAQAPPQGINYQAVARDVSGNIISGNIGIRISIHSGSPTGPLIYQETHNAIANSYGLFTITIGQGTPSGGSAGNFSNIDWSASTYFSKIEINVGSGFVTMGTSQILSVPYALYAKRAELADNVPPAVNINAGSGINVSGGPSYTISANLAMNDLTDVNTSGVSVGQVLKWSGSSWAPANDIGGGVGDNWGSQVVQITSRLTGDGTALNPLDLASQGASNGQVLKWNGTAWTPANDLNTDGQTLSLSGNTLSISGGNSVNIPSGTTYTAGSGINITGSVISALDDSPINEIQTLSLSGNTLTLSGGGGSVTLPGGSLGGSGTVDYVARFTPNGNTLGNSLIRDNGVGIGINTSPTATELVNILTGNSNNGLRVLNANPNNGSYALRGETSGSNSIGYLGYSGNLSLSSYNTSNPAIFAHGTNGSSAALLAYTQGGNTSAAGLNLSSVWHGAVGISTYAGASGVVGIAQGASILSSGIAGFYNGNTQGTAAIFGYNFAQGSNNVGVEGSYDGNIAFGIGVSGIGYNGNYPTGAVDIGVWGSVGNFVNYSIYGNGNFAIANGTKSASVPTSKGNQLLYCIESPEVWFEDFGTAKLTNGETLVELDPLFLETIFIDESNPMIVSVTPLGNCNGLYVEPGKTSFKVKELNGGNSNISFSWRLSCKRLYYPDHRFGADLAQDGQDHRNDFHYVQPIPIDYHKASQLRDEEKKKGSIQLTPRNRDAYQLLKTSRTEK